MGALLLSFSIYFVLLFIVSFAGWRASGQGLEDFFLGGRTLGLGATICTIMATTLSAVLFIGGPAAYYTDGIGFHIIVAEHLMVATTFYFIGGRMWQLGRRYGYINISDLLADRYDSNLIALLLAVTSIAGGLPYMAAQLRGAGLSIYSLSDGAIPVLAGTVAFALIIGGYSYAGGYRSVVWTDIIQGAIMFCVLYLAMILIAQRVAGGIVPLFEKVYQASPASLDTPGPQGRWTYPALLSTYFLWGLGTIMRADIAQRMYSSCNLKTLKAAAALHPIVIFVMAVPPLVIGLSGRVWFQGGSLPNPDQLFPIMVHELLPSTLTGIILVGLLAAMMSTADSQLLSSSSIVMRDLYQRFVNPQPDTRHITQLSRIVLLLFLLGSLVIVLFSPASIVGLLAEISFPVWLQGFPLLVAGLFWRRATRAGALAGWLAGVGSLTLHFAGFRPAETLVAWSGLHPAVVSLVIGSVVLVLVSSLTRPVDRAILDRFFSKASGRD